ncbi:MAG: hypothetical protein WBD27_05550 [Pyrinomonadaceae bacterium]
MERKILTVLSSLAFLCSIASYLTYTQKAEKEQEAYYIEQAEKIAGNEITLAGPYCFPDSHPDLLLSIVAITGVTFLSFCLFKRPFLLVLFSIASVSMFPYWFVETRSALSQTENFHTEGLNMIFYHAGLFDVVVLVLTSIVTFWQVSIVLRAIFKEFGRKKILP